MHFSIQEIVTMAVILIILLIYTLARRNSKEALTAKALLLITKHLNLSANDITIEGNPFMVWSHKGRSIYIITFYTESTNSYILGVFENGSKDKLSLMCANHSILNDSTSQPFKLADVHSFLIGENTFRLQKTESNKITYYDFVLFEKEDYQTIYIQFVEANTISLDEANLTIDKKTFKAKKNQDNTYFTVEQFKEYNLDLLEKLDMINYENKIIELEQQLFNETNLFSFIKSDKFRLKHYQIEDYVNIKLRGENYETTFESHGRNGYSEQKEYYTNPAGNDYNPPFQEYIIDNVSFNNFDSANLSIKMQTNTSRVIKISVELYYDNSKYNMYDTTLTSENENNEQDSTFCLTNDLENKMPWQYDKLDYLPPFHIFLILYYLYIESDIVDVYKDDVNNDGYDEYIVSTISRYREPMVYILKIINDLSLEFIKKEPMDILSYHVYIEDEDCIKGDVLWKKEIGSDNYIFSTKEINQDSGYINEYLIKKYLFDKDLTIKTIEKHTTDYSDSQILKTYEINKELSQPTIHEVPDFLTESEMIDQIESIATWHSIEYKKNQKNGLLKLHTKKDNATIVYNQIYNWRSIEKSIDITYAKYPEPKTYEELEKIDEDEYTTYTKITKQDNEDWLLPYLTSDEYTDQEKYIFAFAAYNPNFDIEFSEASFTLFTLLVDLKQIEIAYLLFTRCKEDKTNSTFWNYPESYYWDAYFSYLNKDYTTTRKLLDDYTQKSNEQHTLISDKALTLSTLLNSILKEVSLNEKMK